jgi:thiol-disulfide isomerase/thioredoxin
LLWILPLIFGCGSSKPLPIKAHEHLEVGWTPRSVLETKTFPWFDSVYAAYQPKGEIFTKLTPIKDSLSFVVIYGTWCSDSRREIPRFFKVMDSLKIQSRQITLFAIDRTKIYPPGPPQEYSIEKVPTFILNYRGVEVGRIVEQPSASLEEDLLNQLLPLVQ